MLLSSTLTSSQKREKYDKQINKIKTKNKKPCPICKPKTT